MPPKHYHHTAEEEISALIRAVDAGWNCLQVGMSFGMRRSFVYLLVKEYTETGRIELRRRGGPRLAKWTRGMTKVLLAVLGHLPESTLTMLKMRLDVFCNQQGLPKVSTSTIQRKLDRRLITLKVATRCPAKRNAPETKDQRADYAWTLPFYLPTHHLVYMDETGFTL